MPPRWLLLEAYHDGSHAALVDGLVRRVVPGATLWTLPARKWKWRMRGASAHFARRFAQERPPVDAIFATSMLSAAELRGLLPRGARDLPLVYYFHENQLAYPVQHRDRRDHHFGWSQMQSALAADRVLFNSAYNRDSFLEELARIIGRMPDARPGWAVGEIRERSEILPVPVDLEAIAAATRELPPREGPCRIAWNHRWEYDKGPDRLLAAMGELVERELDFELVLLGQVFEEVPAEFARLRDLLGPRLVHAGYVESRAEYLRTLAGCDVALSTARHEFQGLAMIEAAACGAVPLVPDALAYREIWPGEWRYGEGGLAGALADRVEQREDWAKVDPRPAAEPWGWAELGPRWRMVFSTTGEE